LLTVTAFPGTAPTGTAAGVSSTQTDGFYFIHSLTAGKYTLKITNSLGAQVGPIKTVTVTKDQFFEQNFNTLNPADPAITGFVKDNSGNAISGVTVQLLDKQGKVFANTVTNDGGYYGFRFTQPSQYTVKIALPAGYTAPLTSRTIDLKQFDNIQLSFSLTPK